MEFKSNILATGTITGSNLSGTNTGDQDLSGYLLTTGKAADSNLLDGIDSSGFVKQLSDTSSPDYTTPSSRRVNPNATNPTNEHYAITTFGNDGNVTGQLATHFVSGLPYTRGFNASWSPWRKIWTDANDGSGSGLDADLLDGQHASAFQPAGTYNTIIGTDSDINTSGSTIIDNIYVTDGVITSMGTRTITIGDIGAAAASHNHDDRYYTESESDSKFVNVTGDTMTGTLTVPNLTIGSGNRIKFANNDYIRYDDANGNGRFHFDADGGTNNASVQAATFVGALSTTGISGSNYNITGVNQLSINDPGEGILFGGGANNVTLYAIDDSTDNKMNFAGASELQVNGSKVFHDGYHPNADKWTTARTLSLTGDVSGSVSWDGSANASITTVVANNSHTHTWATINGETANSVNGWGGLRHQTNDGYIDFGPANSSHAHIYTGSPNFYLNKSIQVLGVSIMNQNDIRSKIFYDVDNTGYYLHPASTSNLNTLNVSTINRNPVVTLSGDVSGSATMTNLGSININATVNDDSHKHSFIQAGGVGPSTEDLNTVADSVSTGQLSYRGFNSSSTNKPPVSDNANGVISVGQHSGGYGAQVAFSSDGNMYWRDNPSSSYGSWRKMWDSGNLTNVSQLTNDSNYLTTSGKAADSNLLDGIDSSSFLRSDANDTFTGTITMGKQHALVANNYGRGVYGVYSSTRYQHVWSMGTAYNLSDGGTSAGNLYGISWTHSNVGGESISGLGHQMLIMSNGDTRSAIGDGVWSKYTIQSTADLRAPIFYDSNNTGYYVNPASTSQLNHLKCSSTLSFGNFTTGVLGTQFEGYSTHSVVRTDAARLDFYMGNSSGGVGTMMTLTKDGNVGIGTTSPSQKLQVEGSAKFKTVNSTTPTLDLISTNNSDPFLRFYDESNGPSWCTGLDVSDEKYKISFDYDNNTVSSGTKLTIATNGNVGIGTTSPSQKLQVSGNIMTSALYLNNGTSLYLGGTFFGSRVHVSSSGGLSVIQGSTYKPVYASAFTVSSDYRLKSNIVPLDNAISRLNQLEVYRFNWNDRLDEPKVDGFIAHEVATVIPEAVLGEKDGTFEDGSPDYQGIDQAKIVPLLTAALQEALQKIENLETRIQTLENN